jgi:hypothetical protein
MRQLSELRLALDTRHLCHPAARHLLSKRREHLAPLAGPTVATQLRFAAPAVAAPGVAAPGVEPTPPVLAASRLGLPCISTPAPRARGIGALHVKARRIGTPQAGAVILGAPCIATVETDASNIAASNVAAPQIEASNLGPAVPSALRPPAIATLCLRAPDTGASRFWQPGVATVGLCALDIEASSTWPPGIGASGIAAVGLFALDTRASRAVPPSI